MIPNAQPKKRKSIKFVSIFIGILGIILMVLGVGAFSQSLVPSGWVRVQGTVVSYEADPSIRYPDGGYPIYQFIVDGKIYRVKGAHYNYKPQIPALGDKHEIAYSPNDPNQAEAVYNNGWVYWTMFGFGLFFFVMALYMYRVSRKLALSYGSSGREGFSWNPVAKSYSQVKFYKKFWFFVTSFMLFPLGPFLVLVCNRHLYRNKNGHVYESSKSYRLMAVPLGILVAAAIIRVWFLYG